MTFVRVYVYCSIFSYKILFILFIIILSMYFIMYKYYKNSPWNLLDIIIILVWHHNEFCMCCLFYDVFYFIFVDCLSFCFLFCNQYTIDIIFYGTYYRKFRTLSRIYLIYYKHKIYNKSHLIWSELVDKVFMT